MLILGFFWITVNDVLFAFGVIILLCLHAVINIYIYLAYTERKSTWWTVKSSCDCEESFQVIPKKNLLLSTGVGWRALEKASLDCSGDDDDLNLFWITVEVEYLDLDIADAIANISSSLPELHASSTFRAVTWDVFCFTFWKSKRF